MDHGIAWCGFLGAWLLVAGPMYQAFLELLEQDIEREALEEASRKVIEPARISMWWWLLPPVAFWLQHRRSERYRSQVLGALTPEQVGQFATFVDKATGWMFVGIGGFLIAVTETWGLVEGYEWPAAAFWVLVVLMLTIATVNTVLRLRRTNGLLESTRAAAVET